MPTISVYTCAVKKAAKRVRKSITKFLETRLYLKVNEEKSSILSVGKLEFLGFEFHDGISISAKAIDKFRTRVQSYCARGSDRSVAKNVSSMTKFLNGWLAHYARIDSSIQCREIHAWFTDFIQRQHTAYYGLGLDPMLGAIGIWQRAYRKKLAWCTAIEGQPSSTVKGVNKGVTIKA